MVLPISSIVAGAKSLITPFIQPLFVPFLYWTLTSLGTIFSVWTNGDRIQDENDFLNPLRPAPYDFIIVGAGSAGCVLANRLSQRHSVLLLEAGGEPNPLQFIPGFGLFFPNIPEVDWGHRTVSQKYASLNSVNAQSSWSTGLGLGGTGTLNYMIHLRGHRRDFDNWAKITGDASWSWEGVLPFFKSYEDYEIPGDNVNHGYEGPLRIEAADLAQTAYDFVAGGVELGYPNVDLNAPFKEGFDIVRFPMKRGVRQAPYKAFLEPIRFRNTLTIMKFAQVNKILFRNGNEAYGVEYDRHGKTYVAQARREVIISAGTVATPKLLMLSGVGPQAHLSSLNIPVLSDLPVGQNLQDHIGVYLGPFFIRSGAGFYLDRDLTIGEFIKWFTLGRGRLTNSGFEATGIISSSFAKARGEGDWPDIQIFSYGLTLFRDGAQHLARIFNLKFDEMEEFYRNDVGKDSLFIIPSGARPLSRGYIELGGSSPYDKPIIDPNYLGDPGEVDLKVLLEAVKTSLHLMENTTALGVNLQARFTTARLPGCEHLDFRSDEYWICYIRRYTVTIHHPVGTASMGSVVDTQLRVLGTKNLRVIDASVQPVVVVTNTQASTLMIAEKGADMILKYWNGIDQGNAKNRPFNSLFGGGGGFGGNNFLWRRNDQKRNILLQGSQNQVHRPNKTNDGKQQLDKVKKVGLDQNAPLPPTGIPLRHKLANNQINEQTLKEKLEKSLQELQLMGELVRQNYDEQFKKGRTAQSLVSTPATTTTEASSSGGGSSKWTSKKPVVNSGNDKPIDKNAGKQAGSAEEEDYYYYDEEDDDGADYDNNSFADNKLATPQSHRSTSSSPQSSHGYHRNQQEHSRRESGHNSRDTVGVKRDKGHPRTGEGYSFYYQNGLDDANKFYGGADQRVF